MKKKQSTWFILPRLIRKGVFMRLSKFYLNILKELPKSIESRSGQLLVKLGIIKKHGKGIYFFTPFGMNILKNVEKTLTEKLALENFSEIDIPIINLKNNFDDSEYFSSKDIDGKYYLTTGPNSFIYEDYMKSAVNSYKDLPLECYSISKKAYNDNKSNLELINPISSKEFKSISALTEEQYIERVDKYLQDTVDLIKKFGIDIQKINKFEDSKGIFYAWLDNRGKEKSLYCSKCDRYYDVNFMEISDSDKHIEEEKEIEKFKTPNIKTIEELQKFTGTDVKKLLKAVLVKILDKNYAIFIRGDRELSNKKLANLLKIDENLIKQASEPDLYKMNTVGGFVGPIGLENCDIIVDNEVKNINNGISGANELDYHIKNINYSRDFEKCITGDIVKGGVEDACPKCGESLDLCNYFKIGEYKDNTELSSEDKEIKYINNQSKEKIINKIENTIDIFKIIGVSLEIDGENLKQLLPWDISILILKPDYENSFSLGEEIYVQLLKKGRKPLLDDRNIKIGQKFKENEILGFEETIVIGRKAKEGIVEYQNNKKSEKLEITIDYLDKL